MHIMKVYAQIITKVLSVINARFEYILISYMEVAMIANDV